MENIFAPIAECAAILIVLISAAIAVYLFRQRVSRRQEELRAWAQIRRYNYSHPLYSAATNWSTEFNPFDESENARPQVYNVIEGVRKGMSFTAFDCSCGQSPRQRAYYRDFSAVIVRSRVPLKPLFIRPAGRFDRIRALVGYNDVEKGCQPIKVVSAAFGHKFIVSSSNKLWASDVLGQDMIEFLLSCPTFAIRFGEREITAYRRTKFSVQDIEAAIDVIGGILERLPQYLLK